MLYERSEKKLNDVLINIMKQNDINTKIKIIVFVKQNQEINNQNASFCVFF